MNPTPDRTLDPQQLIAELQRQLAESNAERDEAQQQLIERTAERDEALAQQTAIAEVLEIINSLARRPCAGVRRDARKGDAVVRCGFRRPVDTMMASSSRLLTAIPPASQISRAAEDPLAEPGTFIRLLVGGEPFVHYRRSAWTTRLCDRRCRCEHGRFRRLPGLLWFALRKDDVLLGVFTRLSPGSPAVHR